MSFSFRANATLDRIGGRAPRVRMQIFPLPADRGPLERFIDRWLNSTFPPEVAFFRPTAPLVLCSVLTYDDMSDEDRRQTGIYAQNEIYFMILLDRLRLRNGVTELVERGVTTPFIFVDSPESALIGRDRFGFPKELCIFEPGAGVRGRVPWAPDASTVLSLRVWEPGTAVPEQSQILKIVRNVRAPDPGFDDASGRLLPPTPSLVSRSDVLWWAQSLIEEASAQLDPSRAVLRAAPGSLPHLVRGELPVTVFNLRQMPHPSRPRSALYRDLVRFELRLSQLQNLRFFHEDGSTLQRPLSLVIRRRAAYPIVESLGLRVIARERRPDTPDQEIWDVVEPVLPLYLQGDVVLGDTARLCWQFDDAGWHARGGAYYQRVGAEVRRLPPLDDHVGGSAQIITGRQPEPPTYDLKYFILPARLEAVSAYFGAKLPRDCPLEIRPRSFDGLVPIRVAFAQARARGVVRPGPLVWQDGRTLSFSVPVTYVHEGVEKRAIYRLVDLIDNPLALIAIGTVYASVVRRADFSLSRFDWFSSTQRARQHQLVWTSTRRRKSQETRILDEPWLDIVSDLGAPPPALSGLAERFADELAQYQSTLHLAGIPDPDLGDQWLLQRISVAEVEAERLVEPLRAEPGRAYWARIRPTENLDVVGELGLVRDEQIDFDSVVSKDFPRAGIDIIPAIGLRESVERRRVSTVRILWSRQGPSP